MGRFATLPSPEAVELLGWAGFDFVIIDAEHGPQGPETVANMVSGGGGVRDDAACSSCHK